MNSEFLDFKNTFWNTFKSVTPNDKIFFRLRNNPTRSRPNNPYISNTYTLDFSNGKTANDIENHIAMAVLYQGWMEGRLIMMGTEHDSVWQPHGTNHLAYFDKLGCKFSTYLDGNVRNGLTTSFTEFQKAINEAVNYFFEKHVAFNSFINKGLRHKFVLGEPTIFIDYIISTLSSQYFKHDYNVETIAQQRKRQKALTDVMTYINEHIDFVRLNKEMGDDSLWDAFVKFKFGSKYPSGLVPKIEFINLKINDKTTLRHFLEVFLGGTDPNVLNDFSAAIDSGYYIPAIPTGLDYYPSTPQSLWLFNSVLHPLVISPKIRNAIK
jgi:hypothetical protein